MGRQASEESEARFGTYVEGLTSVIGHADRKAPLKAYCTGLLLPGERKSVEPMAARVAPGRVQAAHQSLHHFVAKAEWSDAAVLAVVRAQVLPALEQQGPIRAWIVDDTGFPKKGKHSVGVARQYCGQLGKQDNCQIAVSLSVANDHASLPIAYRLYLPESWANDPDRRAKAGVPEDVVFRTKPEIALDQIRAALAAGVPRGVVLADAGYGVDTAFRTGLTEMGLTYVVGIQSSMSLWPPGTAPLPPKPWSGRGRPPSLVRRHPAHKPTSAKQLAQALPEQAWHSVTWREGTNAPLTSRFAAVRVRPAHRDYWRAAPRPEEWCLIEWPRARASRPNTGSPPCRTTPAWPTSSTRPSSDGASSATTRSSSRRSASVTTRGAAGAASTTTPRSPLPPTGSWSPSGDRFPPQARSAAPLLKAPRLPRVTDPAAPPLRPERHVANSIATVHRRLAVAIARTLPRCPCCARSFTRNVRRNL